MRKHRLGKQLLIVLCVSLLVFLAGCRPSPVLEQIIYEQNHQVDPDTETKTMNDDLENEEPDEDIPSRETVDDSEQEKDQEYTSALVGDMDTDPDAPLDTVYGVNYSPNGELSEPAKTNPTEGSTSETATGSTEPGGEEAGITSSGEGGEQPGTEGESGEEAQGGQGAGDEPTDGGTGDVPEDQDAPTSGTGIDTNPPKERVMKEFIDASGEVREIPTDVDTVAAAGEVAPIVEMLGGSGRLVGSSSSFTGNYVAQQTFASQGIYEVQTWWDGDGASTISDGNFQALLEVDPDVCFEISGQDTFSEAQIVALTEQNIGYVVLPKLDSIQHIKDAVTIVGDVLGNRESDGFTNAQAIASNYCTWADDMISLAGGNNAKFTAYIGKWAAEDSWEIYSTAGILKSGRGLPVGVKNAYNTTPLNECMTAANVTNMAEDGYYVEPLNPIFWGPRIGDQSAKYRSYANGFSYDGTTHGLGTTNYPAVVVADSTILNDMLNGESEYFYYHWTVGQQMIIEHSRGFGFDDRNNDGQFVSTYIENAYDILVNPSGVGSWANGSVETPLEAVWLSSMFQGTGDVENEVRNFYNTFYRCDNVDTSAIFPSSYRVTP